MPWAVNDEARAKRRGRKCFYNDNDVVMRVIDPEPKLPLPFTGTPLAFEHCVLLVMYAVLQSVSIAAAVV